MNSVFDLIQSLDETLIVFINSLNSPVFDVLMWRISGKFTWIPFYLLLVFLLFRSKGWKKGGVLFLLVILLISCADQTSVHWFKEVFQRPRPSHNPAIEDLLHFVKGYRGGAYGFISSHAANSFALAMFMSLSFLNKRLTWALFVWAGLVSYSRMYLGVHYLTDILAGAIWGASLGLLFFHIGRFVMDKILKII